VHDHTGTNVIVSGGVGMQQCYCQRWGRNATVHDPKPKRNAHTQLRVKNGRKYTANNKQF